ALVFDLNDYTEQEISDIEWVQEGGNGTLTPLGPDNLRATVTGPSSGWQIQGKILITNDCGVTEKLFNIGGGEDFEFEDGNYTLHKVSPDVYKVYDLLLESYQVDEIEQISAYNIYGI